MTGVKYWELKSSVLYANSESACVDFFYKAVTNKYYLTYYTIQPLTCCYPFFLRFIGLCLNVFQTNRAGTLKALLD